jgi:hypothetical protein
MNPSYPIYIVSKGRADTRMTAKALEHIGVPYHIVIEEQEYDQYAAVIDAKKILVLDKQYQRDYDTFDDLGLTKSVGPGAARNFAWDHSIANGFAWHWVMDDNIRHFFRLHKTSGSAWVTEPFSAVWRILCSGTKMWEWRDQITQCLPRRGTSYRHLLPIPAFTPATLFATTSRFGGEGVTTRIRIYR